MRKDERNRFFVAGGVFAGVLAVCILLDIISAAQAMELTILFVLVCVTVIYAKRTSDIAKACLLYTSPSPRDATLSRMPSSA